MEFLCWFSAVQQWWPSYGTHTATGTCAPSRGKWGNLTFIEDVVQSVNSGVAQMKPISVMLVMFTVQFSKFVRKSCFSSNCRRQRRLPEAPWIRTSFDLIFLTRFQSLTGLSGLLQKSVQKSVTSLRFSEWWRKTTEEGDVVELAAAAGVDDHFVSVGPDSSGL